MDSQIYVEAELSLGHEDEIRTGRRYRPRTLLSEPLCPIADSFRLPANIKATEQPSADPLPEPIRLGW
jgi:hypothetical protein